MLRTLRQAAIQWQEDRASYLGAAIAYYALFSIGPLLVIAIALAGLVYGKEAAEGRLVDTLAEYVGRDSATALQDIVHKAATPESGWAAIIGGLILLFMALGLFQQLKLALQMIWKLQPVKGEGVIAGTVRGYLLALATLLVSVIFAVVFVGGTTVVTLILEVWGHRLLDYPFAVWLISIAVDLVMLTVGFVFLFRLLSDGKISYRYLWGGSLLTAVLFVIGKYLFGFYLANTTILTAYGAASSLVVFLVWVYYSAQMIFFGAEVIQVSRQPSPS
jgi:membrane protein